MNFHSGGSTAQQDVLLVRLENNTFTSDFLGTKVDGLQTPAFTAAAQSEEFVRMSFDELRQARVPTGR